MTDSDFAELTLLRPAKPFRSIEPSHLPDVAPYTVRVGQAGCTAIKRDPDGGFDVFGVDGTSYWVPTCSIAWGKKA